MSNLSPAADRRSYDRESRVVREAAKSLGLRPGTVGQYVRARGIHVQVATILRHAVEAGDTQLAERLYGPIRAAYEGRPVRELTDALIQRISETDINEEVPEGRYRTSHSMADLRTWRDALRAQSNGTLELLAAIDAALEGAS